MEAAERVDCHTPDMSASPEPGSQCEEEDPLNVGEDSAGYLEPELDTGERELKELIMKTKQSEQRKIGESSSDNVNKSGRAGGVVEVNGGEGRDEDVYVGEGGNEDVMMVGDDDVDKSSGGEDQCKEYSDNPSMMCTVECCICGSTILHHIFRKHVVGRHNVNIRNYTEVYGELVFIRKVFHKCKECQEDLLLSFESIREHILSFHNMDLEQYSEKFNIFKVDTLEDPRPEFDHLCWLRESSELGGDEEKYFSTNLDEGCIYKCRVCQDDVLHFLLKFHLRREHCIELADYLAEYRDHIYTRLTYYKCRICQKELLLATEDIISHIREHQISMEDYISEYDAFEAGFLSSNITSLVPRDELLSVRDSEPVDPKLLEEKDFTDNLEYSCLYRCKACRRVVSNLTFERHLTKKHQMRRDEYTDMYGCVEYTRLVYYRCKVCDSVVVFSFDELGVHLREQHQLSLEDYETNYSAFQSTENKEDEQDGRLTSEYHVPLNERLFSDSLDDMCLFKCSGCDKVLYHSLLLRHQQKVHDGINSDWLDVHGKLKVYRLMYYRCKLCPAELLFTITSIRHHILHVHRLTLEDYASKYSGFDTLDKKFNTLKAKEALQKRTAMMVDLDDIAERKRKKIINDGEKYFSDNPEDMCVCKCSFCGKSILHHLLRKHVLSKHPRYKDIHGEYEYVFKTFYRCKVCEAEILFSLEAIKNHVKNSHRLTLTMYKEKYQAFSEEPSGLEHEDFTQDAEDELLEQDYLEKLELESELRDLKSTECLGGSQVLLNA